jgi:hypothetical protein
MHNSCQPSCLCERIRESSSCRDTLPGVRLVRLCRRVVRLMSIWRWLIDVCEFSGARCDCCPGRLLYFPNLRLFCNSSFPSHPHSNTTCPFFCPTSSTHRVKSNCIPSPFFYSHALRFSWSRAIHSFIHSAATTATTTVH